MRRRRRRAPKAAPATKVVVVDPSPEKQRFVQRLARQPTTTASTPILPVNAERVEAPPSFPDDRRPTSRRHTLLMEPIPERGHVAGPPHIPERVAVSEAPRLSTHPNEPIILELPSLPGVPVVQCSVSVEPLGRQPTQQIPEPISPPIRQPTQTNPEPLTRKPTLVTGESVPPVQHSASLPLEGLPSRKNTAPAPVTTTPVPGPDEQPGILNRIRNTWRHSLGSSEAAPTVIQEMKDQERAPSPPLPPRAATMPAPPGKAPTVKLPDPGPPARAPPTGVPVVGAK